MLEWITAISGSIVVMIAILGAVYVHRQVKEARKARLLGPYFEMDRRLHDQREDRGVLYGWTGPRETAKWRKLFERVAVNFDVLGVLVREDMVYRPIVFKLYYDVIIKTWDTVQAHIISERNQGRKSKTYMSDFEFLYQQAKVYTEDNGHEYPSVKNYNHDVDAGMEGAQQQNSPAEG